MKNGYYWAKTLADSDHISKGDITIVLIYNEKYYIHGWECAVSELDFEWISKEPLIFKS